MATYGTFVDGFTLSAAELNTMYSRTSFTPELFQPSSLTLDSSSYGYYTQVNKIVHCAVYVEGFSAGTANNRIEVALPVTAASGSDRVLGVGYCFDSSAINIFRVACLRVSTTRVAFLADASTSMSTYLGQTGGPTFTFDDNDTVSFNIWYRAA